jgi:mRNA interferase MazF
MTKHKIVLIPFPFDDLSGTKLRPALCVTSTIRMHRLITLTTAFIKRELGELPPTVRRQVSAKLKRLFALTEP